MKEGYDMDANIIFKIDKLTTFDKKWTIISDIDLEIKEGEVFSLVGETGSGKTTFINVLSGIIDDYQGQLLYKGVVLSKELRDGNFAFVFEKSSLVNKISVAENLSLISFPTFKVWPFINWRKVNKKAEKYLNYFDIEINQDEIVSNLTPEEKKVIELVKLFMRDPEVVVLHEPTTDLSVDTIQKLYKIIDKFKKNGKTVIYVTKQWEEALKVADKIAVLTKGKLAGVLDSEQAKKNPKNLLNLFLGIYDNRIERSGDEAPEVLDSIFKAAEFLTSEYELKDVLIFLAEHVTKIMGADSCVINLIDEKTETIIDQVNFKKKNNSVPELKNDKVFSIVKNNKFYYTTERDKDFQTIFKNKSQGVKTVIFAPVLIRTQLASVIQLYYNKIYIYSEREWKYLSTFARQAAIAIEDTRLMGRSALLQESHHRIKNNLQSIIGLVSIQKQFINKDIDYNSVLNILDDIMARIKSIAAVHDLLAQDEMGRSIINLKEIVNKVLKFASYPALDKDIVIILDLEDIFIPYNKATTIVLIINELVANCYEHAFKGRKKGKIEILCYNDNGKVVLIIKDNGIGIKENFNLEKSLSLGLNIVYSIITNEFKGEIAICNNNGTEVKVIIPFS